MSKCTRHIAGTNVDLAISKHGGVRWDGVVNQTKCITEQNITEHQLLTKMVMGCGGGITSVHSRTWHDRDWRYSHVENTEYSWGAPTVGCVSKKERCLFLCDAASGHVLAIRAPHGMSARIGVPISVTHARFTMAVFEYAPHFFHMTTDISLPGISLRGLERAKSIGSMHSLYPPWDMCSVNMQRCGLGSSHDIRWVFDAGILFYDMGWRDSDLGIGVSEAGVHSGHVAYPPIMQPAQQIVCEEHKTRVERRVPW